MADFLFRTLVVLILSFVLLWPIFNFGHKWPILEFLPLLADSGIFEL